MGYRPRSVSSSVRGSIASGYTEDPEFLKLAAKIHKLIVARDQAQELTGFTPSMFYTKDTPVPKETDGET